MWYSTHIFVKCETNLTSNEQNLAHKKPSWRGARTSFRIVWIADVPSHLANEYTRDHSGTADSIDTCSRNHVHNMLLDGPDFPRFRIKPHYSQSIGHGFNLALYPVVTLSWNAITHSLLDKSWPHGQCSRWWLMVGIYWRDNASRRWRRMA